jgi:hypothetical protein
MNALASYLKQFSKAGGAGVTTSSATQFKATDILGDIHLLRYLAVNDIISFSMVRSQDDTRWNINLLSCSRINLIHWLILYVRMILVLLKRGWKVLIGKR